MTPLILYRSRDETVKSFYGLPDEVAPARMLADLAASQIEPHQQDRGRVNFFMSLYAEVSMLLPKALVVSAAVAAVLPPADAPVAALGATDDAVTLLNWAISDSTSVICVATNCAAVVFLLASSEVNSFSYLASCSSSDRICDWLLDPLDVVPPTADTMAVPSHSAN